jgi:predicted MFS family arabinose efflux permease
VESERVSFSSVLAVGEFRALWLAHIFSVVGDQLARVALSLLVFNRTGSAGLAALTYALTFLPDLVGGPLLSGLADRYPRRQVMVVADVARALLVAVMAVGGVPFWALCVLLVAVQLLSSPFNAARNAVMPTIMDGDENKFVTGLAIITITYQTAQLAGYVAGGALVAFTGPSTALAVDAGTFVLSGLLIGFGTRHRDVPLAQGSTAQRRTTLTSLNAGARLVWRDRSLRALVGLACISGFYVVAEGLSVPYAHELGGGALATGLLFAASPAGAALGMIVLTRLVSTPTRLRLLGPLAALACAVLMLSAAPLGLALTFIVWAISGAASAYQTIASGAFTVAVPDASRGQAFGLASTALRVAQGMGVVVAGAVADQVPPSWVVAGAGALGTAAAVGAATAWRRAQHRDDGSPG